MRNYGVFFGIGLLFLLLSTGCSSIINDSAPSATAALPAPFALASVLPVEGA